MLIVSGAYIMGMVIGMDPAKVFMSPLNPAIAASIVFWSITVGEFSANGSFICCSIPYGGALLGVLIYEMVYKKAVDAVQEHESCHDSEEEVEGGFEQQYGETP